MLIAYSQYQVQLGRSNLARSASCQPRPAARPYRVRRPACLYFRHYPQPLAGLLRCSLDPGGFLLHFTAAAPCPSHVLPLSTSVGSARDHAHRSPRLLCRASASAALRPRCPCALGRRFFGISPGGRPRDGDAAAYACRGGDVVAVGDSDSDRDFDDRRLTGSSRLSWQPPCGSARDNSALRAHSLLSSGWPPTFPTLADGLHFVLCRRRCDGGGGGCGGVYLTLCPRVRWQPQSERRDAHIAGLAPAYDGLLS
ncbi:hypothetical protein C8Q77DRAFT_410342 [Trametes polyzona]|nr:hypothetical protein C8Q77DRAFT_410342 [Trametes polyzona]